MFTHFSYRYVYSLLSRKLRRSGHEVSEQPEHLKLVPVPNQGCDVMVSLHIIQPNSLLFPWFQVSCHLTGGVTLCQKAWQFYSGLQTSVIVLNSYKRSHMLLMPVELGVLRFVTSFKWVFFCTRAFFPARIFSRLQQHHLCSCTLTFYAGFI